MCRGLALAMDEEKRMELVDILIDETKEREMM